MFASPLARKLAREAGLDISALPVAASGPNGRIVAADVLKAAAMPASTAAAKAAGPAATVAATATIPMLASTAPLVSAGGYSDFELSDLSRALAARLAATKLEVPHYYLSVELDLTNLLRLRAELNGGKAASSSSTVGAVIAVVGGLRSLCSRSEDIIAVLYRVYAYDLSSV